MRIHICLSNKSLLPFALGHGLLVLCVCFLQRVSGIFREDLCLKAFVLWDFQGAVRQPIGTWWLIFPYNPYTLHLESIEHYIEHQNKRS